MTGHTHAIAGAAAGALVAEILRLPVGLLPVAAALGALAALLPDVDEPGSTVNRRLPITARRWAAACATVPSPTAWPPSPA